MDRYVSVISWDDLCAAGGVSSGGFLFFHCYLVLPRERLVTQSAAPLYAEIPADSLNALRLNERNPQGAERPLYSLASLGFALEQSMALLR